MNIILMIVMLSILVLVHELGHFGVARLFKIKVDAFGFGLPFGPTLYEKMWGETKVKIHAFLLGGYVSFPDDDPESDLPEDHPDRISNRPVWQRFCVISAGVAANVVIAFFLILFVGLFSGGLPSGKYDVYVKGLEKGKEYSVSETGIQSGDKIITANGLSIDSPMKFIFIAQKSKKYDGLVEKSLIEKQLNKIKQANPYLSLKSTDVIPLDTIIAIPEASDENPLTFKNAEIQKGIEINQQEEKLSDNQIRIRENLKDKTTYKADAHTTLYDLAAATADTVHPVMITVERKGVLTQLKPAFPNEKGLIGIQLLTKEIPQVVTGPISALSQANDYIYKNTYYMVYGLYKLFKGDVPFEDLHGIVAITKVGGDIIQKNGLWDGLLLMSLISIDLAIINLLPIPALDGGHLLFLLIEKLRGRPVDEQVQETFIKYGFLFLIGLMVLVVINDIWALITNKI